MGTLSRICIALAAFLVVAGSVYGLTSHEPQGATLMIIASATFLFLGMVARRQPGDEEEPAEAEEIHIGPTIWPFGFAISAVVLAMALIVSKWLFVPGGAGFAICAAGWLREVAKSHAH